MSHRIVDLRAEGLTEWFRGVGVGSLITAGPFLVAGILNLLFIESGPKLAAVADFAVRYSILGVLAGTAGIFPTITTHVFNDDYSEGLSGLFKGLVILELTTVVAPFAAVQVSAWAVAQAHPHFASFAMAVSQRVAEIAIFVAAAEAVVLAAAWVAGRLLRR